MIFDDGDDKIKDLVEDLANVKYFSSDKKIHLGAKRNFLNKKANGDIIVCFDDDDYYPPCRIEHAVQELMKSNMLIAGASILNCYFPDNDIIYQYGPYGPYHSCNAALAYKKEYLKKNSYDEGRTQGEEPSFTNNFSNKMIQLDTNKTMLAIVHDKNTVIKRKEKYSDQKLENIVTNSELIAYYRGLKDTISQDMIDYYTVPNVYDENCYVIMCGEERKKRYTLGFQDPGEYKINYDHELDYPEEYVKALAQHLKNAGKRVFIYGNVKSGIHDGIFLHNFTRMPRDRPLTITNLIVWNETGLSYTMFMERELNANIKNIYLDMYAPDQICITKEMLPRIKVCFARSRFQQHLIPDDVHPICAYNGINITLDNRIVRKAKSFCVVTPIISEFRDFIINVFQKLRYNYKNITLNIFTDYKALKKD